MDLQDEDGVQGRLKKLSVDNTNEQMNTCMDDRLFTEIFHGDQRPDNPSAFLGLWPHDLEQFT